MQWKIHQLDVKSAFLNGFLEEEIFIKRPQGFNVAGKEEMVYRLKKALYGLKQAPRARYSRIDGYLINLGFERSISEPTLYIHKEGVKTQLIVSLYVDDLLNCKVTSTPVAVREKLSSQGSCIVAMRNIFKLQKEYSGTSKDDMKSTSGYVFTLGLAVFCWSSKKQNVVAQSTVEAEYVVAAEAMNQALWLRKILANLNLHQEGAIEIKCDNQSAVAIVKNPVFHRRTKHFSIKLHVVREMEQAKEVELVHCNFEDQIADILTKPLSVSRFIELKRKIGVYNMLANEEC
ncbi:uncharacterized protein [Gossypium hirsutum]|uniref:Reverse transcriptase Ty1/copia-type domain-containing protein n=1 Tax=Gossypium hirsutum TaxID=3635 RepID=A0ABM3BZF7_GOSHI|nr:uncharacterized protein LOC121231597 [Gossypium hirsutum]